MTPKQCIENIINFIKTDNYSVAEYSTEDKNHIIVDLEFPTQDFVCGYFNQTPDDEMFYCIAPTEEQVELPVFVHLDGLTTIIEFRETKQRIEVMAVEEEDEPTGETRWVNKVEISKEKE